MGDDAATHATPRDRLTPALPPGLVNLRNTCFLNAALQALASSREVTSAVRRLAGLFESTAGTNADVCTPASWAGALGAAFTSLVRFILHGPEEEVDGDDAQRLARLTAQAARGHFTQQLAAVLDALQPAGASSSAPAAPAAVDPSRLLASLAWFLPEGVLQQGDQNDAAEALELMLDAVKTELTCWHHHQHCSHAGLRQLLQHTPPQQQRDAAPQQLPVAGCTLDQVACLGCGYRFPRSTNPFVCLSLSLVPPAGPSGQQQQPSVPRGARLVDYLLSHSQPECIEGVECLRCSLRASLMPGLAADARRAQAVAAAAAAAAATAAQEAARASRPVDGRAPAASPAGSNGSGGEQPESCSSSSSSYLRAEQGQQEQRSKLLQLLASLAEGEQPLPPLPYSSLLIRQLQLPWRPQRRPVVKQALLSRLPAVLVLQLQRSVHLCGRAAKVQGHVEFPLLLDVGALLHQQQLVEQQQRRDGASSSSAGGEQLGGQADAAGLQHQRRVYVLMAVVQHLGGGSGSGHYIMFRRLQQQQSSRSWVRVSDSDVAAADQAEVLCCHATLLLYERRALSSSCCNV